MTLAEFLAARLGEDEAVAKAATEGPWAWEATGDKDSSWAVGHVQDEDGHDLTGQIEQGEGIIIDGVCEGIDGHLPDAEHIARHDPARMLRDVEAKRAILNAYQAFRAEAADQRASKGKVGPSTFGHLDELGCMVRLLASVYSDNPEYRAEWAP